MSTEQLLTPREIAQILRLGQTATYRLLRRGVLPCFRLGGVLRVRQSDLDAWLANLTPRGGQDAARRSPEEAGAGAL